MNSENVFSFDLFDGFPDLCILIAEDGKIIQLNSIAQNFLKNNDDSAIAKNFFDFIPDTERNLVNSKFEIAKSNSTSEKFYTKLKSETKSIEVSLFFSYFGSAISDKSGEKIFCFCQRYLRTNAKSPRAEYILYSG